VTCNIVWVLVRGDANPSLSDLRRWRSNRPAADCPIRRYRATRCRFHGAAADQRSRRTGNRSATASHTPGSRTGRLGDPGPPDTCQPPGPGRSGTGRPRAGAHRHNNLVVSEAAARRGKVNAEVSHRLTPVLENAQLAWKAVRHYHRRGCCGNHIAICLLGLTRLCNQTRLLRSECNGSSCHRVLLRNMPPAPGQRPCVRRRWLIGVGEPVATESPRAEWRFWPSCPNTTSRSRRPGWSSQTR
jgi:hypothetical protein